MIEPRRKFTDMTRVWDKIRAKKSGGPGGLLCLTVVQARELRWPPPRPRLHAPVLLLGLLSLLADASHPASYCVRLRGGRLLSCCLGTG